MERGADSGDLTDPGDLTAAARVRNAALKLFAEQGVAATSIRQIAAAAGVSPGLVQHHFKSKEELRQAVDAHVLRVISSGARDLPREGSRTEVADEIGRRITDTFRDQPLALRHIARGLMERDQAALQLFDALVGVTGAIVQADLEDGRLWPGVDLEWARLHVLIYNLAVVLLEGAIDRQLSEPLRSPEGLERWRRAATDLFRRGLYQPDES